MTLEKTEREYAYWLCRVPGIGDRTIQKLLQKAGSPRGIYEEGETLWKQILNQRQLEAIRLARKDREPRKAYEELLAKEIRFVLRSDPDYPRRLLHISDAPFALFLKGRLPEEDVPSVAVIGARDCSEYGRFVATELGGALARSGVQLISGMARGIDGISQRAALEAGGFSLGVLGSGVDVCYPRENRLLYERLCAEGGVLSAYPPGTAACPQNFPPRNRIVSGLADALVVVEARDQSGTLITVDMALEQGRDVYAVPGRVTDRLSDGCNRLLKQGAGVFVSPEDFLEEIGGAWLKKTGNGPRPDSDGGKSRAGEKLLDMPIPFRVKQLPPELQEAYYALDLQPQPIEEIRKKMTGDHTVQQLTVAFMRLCMEGLAVQLTPGYFARRGL